MSAMSLTNRHLDKLASWRHRNTRDFIINTSPGECRGILSPHQMTTHGTVTRSSPGGAMWGFRTIALVLLVVMITVVGAAQTTAAQNNVQQRLQDKLDIQALIVRYGTALYTLDADAYAGVFTTDAELDVTGNVRKGRQQIREIVTGLQRSRDENKAKGTPSAALYHVISNTTIEIIKNDEARHRSYWQTVRVGPNNQVNVGAIGQYEDVIVKSAGQWLIRSRKITPFTDGNPAPAAHGRPAPVHPSPAVRLQGLEDMEEIRTLLLDYGRFLDSRDLVAYSRLFAKDGEWVGGFGSARGPEEILAFMQKNLGTGPNRGNTYHILSNFEIVPDRDSATAWSRWTFVTPGADGKPVISQAGRYDDVLVREDGRWRFKRRVASNDIPAPR